jgi:hypothetical protein
MKGWAGLVVVVGCTLFALSRVAQAVYEEVTYPYQGVALVHRVDTVPRNLDMHIALIDLTAPGLRFLVTPENPDVPGACTSTDPLSFMTSVGAQMAVNGDFSFFASYDSAGHPTRDPQSLAVSQGHPYSTFSTFEPAINLAKNNVPTVVKAPSQPPPGYDTTPVVPLWNTYGGNDWIVKNGVVQPLPDPSAYNYAIASQLHPRTAIGYTQDQKRLIVFTVDGRQAGYSEGMNYVEMAQLMHDAWGAYNVINNDGGGSTQFAMANPTPAFLNRPSDGGPRNVGPCLAIFAKPQPPALSPDVHWTSFQQSAVYSHTATSIRSLQHTINAGSNTAIRVGYDTTQGITRGLFSFDISQIPKAATIQSAVLTLDCFDDVGTTGNKYLDFEIFKYTGAILEDQVTWDQRSAGVPWNTPGGDIDGDPLTSLYAQNSTGLMTFVNTVDFTAAVQDAVRSGLPLNLMLRATDEESSASNIYMRFESDDSTTGQRPKLSIAWVPEPHLAAWTALALFALRRRSA